ncbi:nitrite/sulfite reductase [Blastococcus mobilis]|nr:nitrite/sulfite reductase [Blastococcus mobilis]
MTVPPIRERPDACPGALQTHAAADGALARVRLPGGALTAEQLRALSTAAGELGDGALELTSRGNVQLRGLRSGGERELGDRLAEAGLLPSATHETARNVLASVLSGRTGGVLDVRSWVTEFDARMCADPALADLPGRFLTAFDDGRGDVAGLGADVGLLALDRATVALLLAATDTGLRCRPDEAVGLALAATRGFLDERAAQGGTPWRVTELAEGPARIAAALGGPRTDPLPVPSPPLTGPAGAVLQDDGRTALVAVVPLGRLTADQAGLLASTAVGGLQLTPWRSVVVPDLEGAGAAGALAAAGLVLDPRSPWLSVSACAGRPGCAKSLADVRGDVVRAVATGTLPMGGARQHWVGCERRCGRPSGNVVDVVATSTGYRIG